MFHTTPYLNRSNVDCKRKTKYFRKYKSKNEKKTWQIFKIVMQKAHDNEFGIRQQRARRKYVTEEIPLECSKLVPM